MTGDIQIQPSNAAAADSVNVQGLRMEINFWTKYTKEIGKLFSIPRGRCHDSCNGSNGSFTSELVPGRPKFRTSDPNGGLSLPF